MKSDTTFQIELDKLQDLMNSKKFDDAETLVSRMLTSYNKLDYDLLLKRARIKQCQMRYEDAMQDANLAHNIQPQREEAYHALSDFLLALNEHEKSQKVLSIINTPNAEPMIKNMYDMITKVINDKK
jgi:tetratricopeptide (TPR) repeat protein